LPSIRRHRSLLPLLRSVRNSILFFLRRSYSARVQFSIAATGSFPAPSTQPLSLIPVSTLQSDSLIYFLISVSNR
jgi:hypothetical protein